MKNKFGILKLVAIITLSLIALCSFSACGKQTTISHKSEYVVVKVGDTVTLPELKAVDTEGNSYATELVVNDKDGNPVTVTDRKFIADKEGKYTAKYTHSDSQPFSYSVYAFADGKEYQIVTEGFTPMTGFEWNTQVTLATLKAENRVTGDKFDAIPSVSVNDTDVPVNANVFVSKTLGEHTVKYSYKDAEYTFIANCECTVSPEIYLKSSANVNPEYGEEFMLPYYAVSYPESRVNDTQVSVFKDGDESLTVSVNNKRFLVTTAREYTYRITVSYTDKDGLPQVYSRDFTIKRSYDDVLDRVNAWIEGDTVMWEDRQLAVNAQFINNDYYQVLGYEISFDDGETFTDCTGLSYTVTQKGAYKIIVREKRANQNEYVASSNPLIYDGTVLNTVASSFDGELYENSVANGSHTPWQWEIENVMQYEIRDEEDGHTGVLCTSSTGYTGVKITFNKSYVLKAGDIVGLKLKFIQYDKIGVPGELPPSGLYVSKYGKDYGKGVNPGTDLLNCGLVYDEWTTIYFDAQTYLETEVGENVDGIELYTYNGGYLFVDEIYYYPAEDFANNEVVTFNYAYTLGLVGVSGAQYDDTIPNQKDDLKNRYNYWANEDGNIQTEVLENGYENSGSGVLKVSYNAYGSVGIRFAKSVIVTERTVIDIVYYSLVQNRNVLIVSRYGQDELKQDLSSFAIAGAWSHMLVKATDLGYTVGQEVTGIDLYLSENAGVIYIDEVLCFDMEELSNGVVSSFDYGYYASNLTAPGAEYSDTDLLKREYYYYFRNSDPDYGIEKVQYGIDVNGYAGNRSGVLKVTYDKRGSIGIKFAKAETVTANTKVTVRLYYNDTSLYISRFGSDSLGVKNENLTANAWIDVTVSATELGYSVGETIDGLDLYFGEYDGVVYIDYITVTNN